MTKQNHTREENKAQKILKIWIHEYHYFEDFFDCIKITFDGHPDNDSGQEDQTKFLYSIFINKDSHLVDTFPAHKEFLGLNENRDDDYRVYACLDTNTEIIQLDLPECIETGLDWHEAIKIILAIDKKFNG